MTEKAAAIKKRSALSTASLAMFIIFLFLLFLKNSSVASLYIKNGISVCISTLIPSLFPYLVLSDILLSLSIQRILERPFKKVIPLLFGVSGSGVCAFILGIFCGFPLGARTAVDLLERREISKGECERLIAFCNIPSLAFTVGVVGSLFQSTKTGFCFWAVSVICAVAGGTLNKLFHTDSSFEAIRASSPVTNQYTKSSGTLFVRAIERSAKSTLLICAYVIFFSAFTGCLSFLLLDLDLKAELKCLLFGFFELTNGIKGTAEITSTASRAMLCGFFLGWSGLSVHLQIFSICDGKGLGFKNYILQKLFQGILCALLSRTLIVF